MKFNSFNLSNETLKTLERLSFVSLSPIQEETLAIALKGQSLVAQAPTGSGKSHSFIIPLIERIDAAINSPQVLILVPTIELGRQTLDFIQDFQTERPSLTAKFLEDVDQKKQVKSQIIIATPAKLHNIKINSGIIDFSNLKIIVLDEADMLSSDEFFSDIDLIIESINKQLQYLIFSATYSKDLVVKLKKYVQFASVIKVNTKIKQQNINYYAVDVRHQDRLKAILNLINITKPYLLLIFAKTNEMVERISTFLSDNSYKNIMLHGKLTSQQRKQAFKEIKANLCNIVVCSDLMARGIDFQDASDVLSFDIPKEYAFFFHRIGRTARFDKQGNAYLFYDVEEISKVEELERLGAPFEYLSLYQNELRKKREQPGFLKNKNQSDVELQQNIKKALRKVDRTTVKPNYKKKAKVAREKEIKKHNRRKLKEKIKKEKYNKKGS